MCIQCAKPLQKDFIKDVLLGYTTYDFAFKLEQAGDDKAVKSGKAKAKLFRYAQLHPTSIAQEVTAGDRGAFPRTRHAPGGRANQGHGGVGQPLAAVATEAFDDYIRKMKYDCRRWWRIQGM